MQLNTETRQPDRQVFATAERSPWSLGLTGADEGSSTTASGSPDSFTAECECPDDCLRDHENE